jgi:hypothetical protein
VGSAGLGECVPLDLRRGFRLGSFFAMRPALIVNEDLPQVPKQRAMVSLGFRVIRHRRMRAVGSGDVDVKLLARSLGPNANGHHDGVSVPVLERPHISWIHSAMILTLAWTDSKMFPKIFLRKRHVLTPYPGDGRYLR